MRTQGRGQTSKQIVLSGHPTSHAYQNDARVAGEGTEPQATAPFLSSPEPGSELHAFSLLFPALRLYFQKDVNTQANALILWHSPAEASPAA